MLLDHASVRDSLELLMEIKIVKLMKFSPKHSTLFNTVKSLKLTTSNLSVQQDGQCVLVLSVQFLILMKYCLDEVNATGMMSMP